ncbi:hypothetical protein M3Y95_00459300 [Aphelenchoides besseyi]|nr:hypothetical protein M3Y95_00459300 [Aphelenchoides besseyi]
MRTGQLVISTTMSRPQLTTYSKAILLMHRHKHVCDRPPDNKMSATEFFKYLLISRHFLRASQLYQIYLFVISKYCKNKKFDIFAMNRKGFEVWLVKLKLKLKDIKTMNLLLNAQYAVLPSYEYKYAKEFSAVCKIFTGHILVDLSDDVNAAKKHVKIIKQVHKQLYSLRCDVKSLVTSPDMPQLDLPYGDIYIVNLYQFKQVMAKHQIKKVWTGNNRMQSPRFDETIDNNFFDDFPTCPSVERLIFSWKDLNADHNLVSKVTEMVPFFPRLRKLYCCFRADHYTAEQFSLQQLVVWIRNECKELEELQKTKIPFVSVTYTIKIRKTESQKVVKQVVKEMLKTTKFSQLYMAESVIRKSNDNVIDKPYSDVDLRWISLKFHVILKFTIDLDPLTLNDIEPPEDLNI